MEGCKLTLASCLIFSKESYSAVLNSDKKVQVSGGRTLKRSAENFAVDDEVVPELPLLLGETVLLIVDTVFETLNPLLVLTANGLTCKALFKKLTPPTVWVYIFL